MKDRRGPARLTDEQYIKLCLLLGWVAEAEIVMARLANGGA